MCTKWLLSGQNITTAKRKRHAVLDEGIRHHIQEMNESEGWKKRGREGKGNLTCMHPLCHAVGGNNNWGTRERWGRDGEGRSARTRALFAFCYQANKHINKHKQINKETHQALQDRKQDYGWQMERCQNRMKKNLLPMIVFSWSSETE